MRNLQKQKFNIGIRRRCERRLCLNLQKQKFNIGIRLKYNNIMIKIYKSRNLIQVLDLYENYTGQATSTKVEI